jgi:leader peptidase (prepilin peptidase)/N-methyltransferase
VDDNSPANVVRHFPTRALVGLSVIAFALVGGVVLLHGFSLTALAYSFFVVIGVWLSAVDLRFRILPNRVVLPAIGIGLVLLLAAGAADGGVSSQADVAGQALRVVLGGSALFVVFLTLALISPKGLGMGDVKLAALVGMFLAFDSWTSVFLGTAVSFICAALIGGLLLMTRRAGPAATIPFGPLMFLGAALVLVF